jgi:hypothetical protein
MTNAKSNEQIDRIMSDDAETRTHMLPGSTARRARLRTAPGRMHENWRLRHLTKRRSDPPDRCRDDSFFHYPKHADVM